MRFLTKPAGAAAGVIAFALALTTRPDAAHAGPDPYIGDILALPYTFCPRNWAKAEGQLLPIAQNQALFSLYGTTFGGDGKTTFALPDLRGRAASGQGSGPGLTPRQMGQKYGVETETISVDQMPSHSHAVNATDADGSFPGPGGKLLGGAPSGGTGSETIYSDQPANKQMSAQMISPTGGGQPFSTRDPYIALQYCVALVGVFPPHN